MRCLDPSEAADFVQDVLFKVGEFRGQGTKISDDEVMCVLLNGLPSEFSALVQSIDRMPIVTIDHVIDLIRQFRPVVDEEHSSVTLVSQKRESGVTQAEFFAEHVWDPILQEAVVTIQADGGVTNILSNYFYRTILEHKTFGSVLSHLIASKFFNENLPKCQLFELVSHAVKGYRSFCSHPSLPLSRFLSTLSVSLPSPSPSLSLDFLSYSPADPLITDAAEADLMAHISQDPACHLKHVPLLYAKGFLAIEVREFERGNIRSRHAIPH
jgi:hypothetical protein